MVVDNLHLIFTSFSLLPLTLVPLKFPSRRSLGSGRSDWPSGPACRAPHNHCYDVLDSCLTPTRSSSQLISLDDTSVLTTSQIPQLYLTLKHFFQRNKQIKSLKDSGISPNVEIGCQTCAQTRFAKGCGLMRLSALQASGPDSVCCERVVPTLQLSDGPGGSRGNY